MTTPSEPHQVLKRYLTPFYGFTLGLALALAIFASLRPAVLPPEAATATRVAQAQTASPTRGSAQANGTTPTPLPIIPPTLDEQTPSPLGVPTAELNGLIVTLWHPWTGQTSAALMDIVDEFNRTNHWGLTVKVKGYEGFSRLDEAVDAALLPDTLNDISVSLPDILVDYGYQARHWDANNIFVDLTPYQNDHVWGFTSQEQDDFYPAFWTEDLVSSDRVSSAKRQGIPFYRSAYVLFYNQSWGRELGYLQPPITLEDFRAQACAAADEVDRQGGISNQGKGGWLITPQPGALVGWLYAFGSKISDPGGSGYQFNTSSTVQAFEYLKALQESGCAWTGAGVEAQSEFVNRHALFMVGSLFDMPSLQQVLSQAGNKDEWKVIPFPSMTKPVVATYGPSLFVFRSNPAQQLAAWLAIEWLVYPPNLAKFADALGAYPTRSSSINYLSPAASRPPQWIQALELISAAQSEPNQASWSVMRWALADVMAQLFDPQFRLDQIPSLQEHLIDVADEIASEVH